MIILASLSACLSPEAAPAPWVFVGPTLSTSSIRLLHRGASPFAPLPAATLLDGRPYALRRHTQRFTHQSIGPDVELLLRARQIDGSDRWVLMVDEVRQAEADASSPWADPPALLGTVVSMAVDVASGAITAEHPNDVNEPLADSLVEMVEALSVGVPAVALGQGARWEVLLIRHAGGTRITERGRWTLDRWVNEDTVQLTLNWIVEAEDGQRSGHGSGSAVIGPNGIEMVQRTGVVNASALDGGPDRREFTTTYCTAGMDLPILPH